MKEVTFKGNISPFGGVDNNAFQNCPELQKVSFEGSIAVPFGTNVFNTCPKLELIEFKHTTSVPTFVPTTFAGTPATGVVKHPCSFIHND